MRRSRLFLRRFAGRTTQRISGAKGTRWVKDFSQFYLSHCTAAATALQAFAQVGPGIRFVPEADGLIVTGPANDQTFRMKIAGDNVGRLRTKKKYWFRVDGVKFEFFSEENSRFVMTDLPKRLDDRFVLELYRSEFLRRNGNLKVRSTWLALKNGETALLMSYDKFVAVPDVPDGSEREMMLVIAGPGRVFGLFAPVSKWITAGETQRALIRTLGSIEFCDVE